MGVALDNDFFVKFEICGLLDEVLACVGRTRAQCFRLPSLPNVLRRGKKMRANYGGTLCDSLVAAAESLPPFPDEPSHWLDELAKPEVEAATAKQIDAGEAQLIAAVCEKSILLLGTHDKRAMRAVPKVDGLADALSGRVVLVEHGCLMLCDAKGIAFVREKVAALTPFDNGLRAIFASSSDDGVIEGLKSFISDVEKDCGASLFWRPT